MSIEADISRGPDLGNDAGEAIEEQAAKLEQNQERSLDREQETPNMALASPTQEQQRAPDGLSEMEQQEITYGMHAEAVVERTTGQDVAGADLQELTNMMENLPQLACQQATLEDALSAGPSACPDQVHQNQTMYLA